MHISTLYTLAILLLFASVGMTTTTPSSLPLYVLDPERKELSPRNIFIEPSKRCDLGQIDSSPKCLTRLYDCIPTEENSVSKKRVLVTGGSGFVGSHLVDSLMLDGYQVHVLDNFSTGRPSNTAHWWLHNNFKLIARDVAFTPPSNTTYHQIYHLAAPASPTHYMSDPIKTIDTIVSGTKNILEMARRSNQTRVVIASTSEIYGDPLVHPQTESYWGNTNPIGPRSCYDESKRLSESLAVAYAKQHNISIAIARIFNTYGPRMHPKDGRVISNLVSQAVRNDNLTIYGDGKQTRSFQYVSDLVSGLRALMASNVTGPVNLGNPHEISILTLAKEIKQLVPDSESSVEFHRLPIDDPSRRRPDISRALSELAWRPVVTLSDGLKRTVGYFRQEVGR